MSEASILAAKASHARRLARSVGNEVTAKRLEILAEEFERKALAHMVGGTRAKH